MRRAVLLRRAAPQASCLQTRLSVSTLPGAGDKSSTDGLDWMSSLRRRSRSLVQSVQILFSPDKRPSSLPRTPPVSKSSAGKRQQSALEKAQKYRRQYDAEPLRESYDVSLVESVDDPPRLEAKTATSGEQTNSSGLVPNTTGADAPGATDSAMSKSQTPPNPPTSADVSSDGIWFSTGRRLLDLTRSYVLPQQPQVPVPDGSRSKASEASAKSQLKTSALPRQFLEQQRGLIARSVIDKRTRELCRALRAARSNPSILSRVEDIINHLLTNPDTRAVAMRHRLVPVLVSLCYRSTDDGIRRACREALALMGWCEPPVGRGVRVLTIDGGGTRGLLVIEALRNLERATDRRVPELFDFVCGSSTGALLAVLLAVFRMPLDEAAELYRDCSSRMFERSSIVGTGKLFLSQAYYDTPYWEQMLRDNLGEVTLSGTARSSRAAKVAAVSTLVNTSAICNFVFRSYNPPAASNTSHYRGTSRARLWQAVRCSTAAPGYYEPMTLHGLIHQDGGLLANNPTAIALHEVKLLWPDSRLQCVVSVGTGRYQPHWLEQAESLGIKDRLTKLVKSATDTEAVHTILQDLLPPSVYYRFNPYLSADYMLDENRPDQLDSMVRDAQLYLRRNHTKIQKAAAELVKPRHYHQRAADWCRRERQVLHGRLLRASFQTD